MPSLGSDMVSGQLTEWLVAPGDHVARGDVVAVVETQKGAIEIEIFEDGVVDALLAQPGQTLAVGAPMAEIRGSGESIAPSRPESLDITTQAPPVKAIIKPATVAGAVPAASPAARRLAGDLGVDLSEISGSGPQGAILRVDVERAAKSTRSAFEATEMRKAIGAAMQRSKRDIPHFYLSHEIDLQAAGDWLASINLDRDPEARLLMAALFVKATALAAAEAPEMNGHYVNDAFHPAAQVNAGLAVSLRGGGLVAPAIMGTEALSLDDLMSRIRDFVLRARSGRLRGSELTEATLTISSLGDGGVDAMTGVIFPPQVAIVAFGSPRPVARPSGDGIEPRLTVTATLSADHRVSDGRAGARFLKSIDTFLQRPEAL